MFLNMVCLSVWVVVLVVVVRQEQMQQQAQQQSLLNAGEKIAGNIPPKTLGETILNNQ